MKFTLRQLTPVSAYLAFIESMVSAVHAQTTLNIHQSIKFVFQSAKPTKFIIVLPIVVCVKLAFILSMEIVVFVKVDILTIVQIKNVS
jgi:hypothetical protein